MKFIFDILSLFVDGDKPSQGFTVWDSRDKRLFDGPSSEKDSNTASTNRLRDSSNNGRENLSNTAQTFINAPRRENLDPVPTKLQERTLSSSPTGQSHRKNRKSLEDELFGAKMQKISPNEQSVHPLQQRSNPASSIEQNPSSSTKTQSDYRQHPLNYAQPETASNSMPHKDNRAASNEPKQKYDPLPPNRPFTSQKDIPDKPNVHDTLDAQVDKMNKPNSSLRNSKGFPRSNYKAPQQQAQDTQDYLKPFRETSNIQPLDKPIEKQQKSSRQEQPPIRGTDANIEPTATNQNSQPSKQLPVSTSQHPIQQNLPHQNSNNTPHDTQLARNDATNQQPTPSKAQIQAPSTNPPAAAVQQPSI